MFLLYLSHDCHTHISDASCVHVGLPTMSNALCRWLGVLPLNSRPHFLPGESIRSHRLRAQSRKTAALPRQIQMVSPGCHLSCLPLLLLQLCPTSHTSVVSNSVRPHRWQPTGLRRPWDSPGKNTGVGCYFLFQGMKVKIESEVAQLCPTLCDPVDCSPPGSSVHGIFQAGVLEWVVIAFSAPAV